MSSEEFPEVIRKLKSDKAKLESNRVKLESKQAELESKLSQMQFQLDQIKRMVYGSKRERFIPAGDENQMTLPFDVEPEPEQKQERETITYERKKAKRENHPGRLPLPDHLPVEEIIIEPEEDTTGMKCIGREVTD